MHAHITAEISLAVKANAKLLQAKLSSPSAPTPTISTQSPVENSATLHP
jgi:hypothetical protein